MNGLLIVTGIIFLICVIAGLVRGFIKIVASLAATIAIIVLVVFLTPYVSEGILKVTPLETYLQKKCIEMVAPDIEMDTLDIEKIEIPRDMQIEAIEKAKLPEIFRKLLLENNNAEVYQTLGVQTFGEYAGAYLAKIVADIVAFLLTLFVVTVVVRTIIYAFGIIGDLPVIGGLNRLAGGVLGLGSGLIIVWVIFIIVTLLYSTSLGEMCFQNISDSEILSFLYEHNILMDVVTKFR